MCAAPVTLKNQVSKAYSLSNFFFQQYYVVIGMKTDELAAAF